MVVEVDGRATTLTGTRRVLELQLPNPAEAHRVAVRSEGPCFVDVIQRGIPLYGEEYADKRGLELSVDYRDLNGFPMDIGQVKVGATMTAHVRVKRTQPGVGLERMACWFMLPDGWEVTNTRLSGEVGSAGVNYQDFRDDRVMLYFDLASGQTQLLELEVIATYPGRFYLPGTYVEAMYDDQLQAAEAGRWVVVSAD